VFRQISIDRRLQVDNRAEDAATDPLARHLGEEVLHSIEPGRRGRGEHARLAGAAPPRAAGSWIAPLSCLPAAAATLRAIVL
jgi:hypothetical protein